MKNKKFILGAAAFIIAGLGLYFILRKPKEDVIDIDPEIIPEPSGFDKYRVSTQSTSLNVRESPSTSSRSVSSLSRNQIIFARPSSTSGWYEYSADGRSVNGYVSKMYLSSNLSGGSTGGGSSSGGGNWEKYKVNTASTSLNVRERPNTSSRSISSLSKGATIFARPSSAAGWYEYSSNGSSLTGYVSGSYLLKI